MDLRVVITQGGVSGTAARNASKISLEKLKPMLPSELSDEEAEEVYRADLGLNDTVPRCAQHKNNVWALHGIVECLKERNGEMECNELQGLLAEALSKTDLTITSSCCCRKTVSQSST
mgnify:FL=1